MRTVTRETEPYLERFSELERELAGRKRASLLPLRREAMARFAELGYQRVETFSPAACAGTLLDFLSGRFGLGR